MKKIVFIGREKGCLTPEAVAKHLTRHGHLEGIIDNRKYVTYAGKGYQFITVAGKVVQVIEMPEADCKRIGACSGLKFGGF